VVLMHLSKKVVAQQQFIPYSPCFLGRIDNWITPTVEKLPDTGKSGFDCTASVSHLAREQVLDRLPLSFREFVAFGHRERIHLACLHYLYTRVKQMSVYMSIHPSRRLRVEERHPGFLE
jgi:hypothetical protein